LRLFNTTILLVLLLAFASPALADKSQMLEQFGSFRRAGLPDDGRPILRLQGLLSSDLISAEKAEYLGTGGQEVRIEVVRFRQDTEAYELLSLVLAAARRNEPDVQIGNSIGTAGFIADKHVAFFKGVHFVRITSLKPDLKAGHANLEKLAQEVSTIFPLGENDIPALIKHLPNPDEAQKNAVYLHSFTDPYQLGLQQGVLSAIDSRGNADAALASYDRSKVLIVEFNTPQLATENDQRIIARIQELWKLGEPAPTAYRRVGNYSVFVFDAPDEQSAKQLIDQVKYEQVVQWLGENPNILKRAQEEYVNTTLGVLVAVVKASGYALLACLGLGGLAGALLFNWRRGQQQSDAAFSDAGGMLRLNLDDLTPETNPARLLRDRN